MSKERRLEKDNRTDRVGERRWMDSEREEVDKEVVDREEKGGTL
jgi:hypothetical protein